ncbi:ExbD/TolR family protein [Limnoglobus roseus]|uniref:Biopolymer transport protein ExbD/TolR n=1 Tax=Limnoglobus roseus TaxID=2598579 RepID=A0A5C1AEM0_9BACT|nr:biopolymer transporter ExbD [Limnoglobus roseus]QEL17200.1 Biopolymer transport protein ExbD/TolR [Limnoglobus roseus]
MSWKVRPEGSETAVEVPTAQRVLDGIREGEWEPTDDVRGPADAAWVPIEEHVQFADAIAEMGAAPIEMPDETHLDMNPLIDVALVLLIFFILTTTYAVLRRTIDVPSEPEPDKGMGKQKRELQEVQERSFKVEAWLIDDRPRVKINDKIIEVEDLEKSLKDVMKATNHREMLLEFEGRVPWGVLAQIIDAAKAAEVTNITFKRKKAGG